MTGVYGSDREGWLSDDDEVCKSVGSGWDTEVDWRLLLVCEAMVGVPNGVDVLQLKLAEVP